MLHLDDSFTGNSTDMTVLQRHQAIFGCQHEDQRQDNNAIESYAMPQHQSLVGDDSMVYQELMSRSMNADQYLGSMFPTFRELQLAGTEFIGDTISIAPLQLVTSSSPEVNNSFSVGLNLKKRKADELIVEECCNDDEIGVEVRQGESAAIETTNLETSTYNSKVSDVQKPDYILVRARRGQATDSHSLAERARREKINKKMKCLQDLVPGCSKVAGKAGMLDEIINYVQSLQRQIEFLSMKLAALNPRLDFDMDRFSMEEPLHLLKWPIRPTSLVKCKREPLLMGLICQ